MRFLSFLVLFSVLSFPSYATQAPPLSRDGTTYVSATNLSTSAVVLLAADGARKFLQIQNISTNSNTLACTVDGTTPVVGSVGAQLVGSTTGAGGSWTFDVFVPTGAVTCIGSAASTGYFISYDP